MENNYEVLRHYCHYVSTPLEKLIHPFFVVQLNPLIHRIVHYSKTPNEIS